MKKKLNIPKDVLKNFNDLAVGKPQHIV